MSSDALGVASARERVLADLAALVACDSQNPPRRSDAVVDCLGQLLTDPELGHFRVQLEDLGNGSVNLLAVRGTPRVLVNVHVDTVPICPGWTREPHRLEVRGDRAYGLGACDIKGGAAALLEAARQTARAGVPAAFLFSTDEEAGQATCIRAFTKGRALAYELVVVAEPTECRAVTAHRGVLSAKLAFSGLAGHASDPRARHDSANHALVAWAHAALAHADACESLGAFGAHGVRFNLGRIEGGEKSNMISAHAEARFGLRPPPGIDPVALAQEMFALAPAGTSAPATGTVVFSGPPLPAPNMARDVAARARAFAERVGIALAPPVDFWTEASLFSEASVPALVCGPGNIAQAHTADEWVALTELDAAVVAYRKILEGSSP